MKINFMRKIDEILGPFVCRILLFIRSFLSPFPESKGSFDVGSPEKILVIKFFGAGSILLASPTFNQLKESYPEASLSILTLCENKEVCSVLSSLDNIYTLDIKDPFKFIGNYLKLMRVIKKEGFDVIIDLEFITNFSAFTTLLISLMSSCRTTVGFLSPLRWRNNVYSMNISFDHSRHITNVFGKVASALTGKPFALSFETSQKDLLASAKSSPDIEEYLSADRLNNKTVCVNINAGVLCHLRRWPHEKFVKLLQELNQNFKINIILIGGKGDVDYVNEFSKKLPDSLEVFNSCGELSIKELIGLFSQSDLLITNDSGPLHFASLIDLPTLSFFGPETPSLYGPIGPIHHVFYEDIYCSPCINIYNSKNSDCQSNICLKRIQPEDALRVVKQKKYLV